MSRCVKCGAYIPEGYGMVCANCQEEIEEAKMYTVYIHTNKENNKCYIGITNRQPNKRWQNGTGYRHNKYFTSAVEKYGWDNFDHIIFAENLPKYEACKMERLLIALYDSTNPLYGYNQSIGGECGRSGIKHTEETRKKISKAHKGKHLSEKTRLKMSETRKGKHRSEETRRKMSAAQKGRHISEEHRRKLSEALKNPSIETRRKNGEAHKRENLSAETLAKKSKPILCVELNKIFSSIREAEKELNIGHSSISAVAKGKRKLAGGYHWKYAEIIGSTGKN